ncbi:hypothetical protein [Natrinema gelatinilyticum]|uniref:hypothetical protein n=1 Tax=Natrinema gelatinilyticum TaxID=2961571 RepID=UPI0020C3CFD6|nr:hypothetical protein [Natrinema gelatinilyticum]
MGRPHLGVEAYWVFDPSAEQVVVTRSQRTLDEHAEFNRIDSSAVSDEGRLSFPEELLTEDDEYPWTGYFEVGDRVTSTFRVIS